MENNAHEPATTMSDYSQEWGIPSTSKSNKSTNPGICRSKQRPTPIRKNARHAASAATKLFACVSAATTLTCEAEPSANPWAKGEAVRSAVALRINGQRDIPATPQKIVLIGTHSSLPAGRAAGMVSARPVVVVAGRTEATSVGESPSKRLPTKAVKKKPNGATQALVISNGLH